jgi:uncharacterized protein (TIGR02145 family)
MLKTNIVVGLASVVLAGTASAQALYGSLAVDRSNGFYYGFAFDQASLAEAEARANKECSDRGGSCSTVLSWSGHGCGAYRTIDGKAGTAYGWGIAATKEQADATAQREAAKRSQGKSATNHAFACNSGAIPLKVLKNVKPPAEVPVVTIGNQVWMARNLDTRVFNNGDPIPLVPTQAAWRASDGKPAARILNNTPQYAKTYGLHYNWYAATDARGVCPAGFRLPSQADWQTLVDAVGGMDVAGANLRSTSKNPGNKTGADRYVPGRDKFGFNAVEASMVTGGGDSPDSLSIAGFWASDVAVTKWPDQAVTLVLYDMYEKAEFSPGSMQSGYSIRCIKE